MADQFSADIRNGMGDQIASKLGASPLLKLFFGAQPASTSAADAGPVLASGTLPSTWMAAFSGGVGSGAGLPWSFTGQSAAGGGTAMGHFRMYTSGGVCKWQGSVGTSAATMIVNTTTIANAGTGSVTGVTITAPNA